MSQLDIKKHANDFMERLSGEVGRPKIFYDMLEKLKSFGYEHFFNPDMGFTFRRFNPFDDSIDLVVIQSETPKDSKNILSYIHLKSKKDYNKLNSAAKRFFEKYEKRGFFEYYEGRMKFGNKTRILDLAAKKYV